MDNTTICKFLICIGILRQISLHHVDGIPFQVSEMVEWSKAESTCQKFNGTLFIPNETLFDVSPFSEFNFNDESWVAATYTILSDFVSASWLYDSVVRCVMCKIEKSCGTTCLYTACGNRCKAICESLIVSQIRVLSDIPNNWIGARDSCQQRGSKFGDRIQNASSLFPSGYCNDECFWTNNLIQVHFQSKTAPENEQGECGILHNDTLSFTKCNRRLHPLCEREDNMTTIQASKSTNRINPTIKTSYTYGQFVTNSISTSTDIGLNEENTSLVVPVVASTSRNDVVDTPHKSDTGIIIGAVVGCVVLLIMTVLVIIYFRRRRLQRKRERKSNHESKCMNMQETYTIDKSIYAYQCVDVTLETGPGLTPFVHLESKCEGPRSGIVRQISNDGISVSKTEPEGSNYATVTKKANVNTSNSTYNTNYDICDHLNGIQESRNDNLAGNVYDKANFEQRNGCICSPDSIYSISGGHSKTLDDSVGLYDRVNNTISDEYDTTDDLGADGNPTYDHI